jgi:hypothetical protein
MLDDIGLLSYLGKSISILFLSQLFSALFLLACRRSKIISITLVFILSNLLAVYFFDFPVQVTFIAWPAISFVLLVLAIFQYNKNKLAMVGWTGTIKALFIIFSGICILAGVVDFTNLIQVLLYFIK